MKKNKLLLLLIALSVILSNSSMGQDSTTQEEVVKLHYFNHNNSLQYLVLESLLKKGKKTQPQKHKVFKIFLGADQPENLVTKVLTDDNGKAKSIIPPQLKNIWDSAGRHTFLVVAEATSKEEEVTTPFTFTKAKILLDTSSDNGTKHITVSVTKYEGNAWIPAKDVEMKIGIQRMGGILPAADQDSYTTDSSGMASADFNKETLPGDEHGDVLLVARVDDNEELGNLIIEKKVRWGIATQSDNGFFNQRALWSTRFKTPLWLLFMAYSIVIGVWGTLIYLVIQLIKIKKLSTQSA